MSLRIAIRGLHDDAGQELVEAAIVLPIIFLILFAIFWFGRAFNIIGTLERAARAGLQSATHSTCASCGNTPPTNGAIVTSINTVLQADHLQTGDIISYSPPYACTGASPSPVCTTLSNNAQVCTNVPLTCGGVSCQSPPVACGANPALGTRISFAYQFDAPLPFVNLHAFTISASAQSEPEQ
ncbi:MAG: TadE/TadG family type IV pilus assembly protein [Terriglobales bacterium]